MDLEKLEQTAKRARSRPLLTVLLVVLVGVGLFASAYLSEKGRRFASSPENPAASSSTLPPVADSTPALPVDSPTSQSASSSLPPEAEFAVADKRYLAITFEAYVAKWYGSATSLQRDEFEREVLGRLVVWEGKVDTVEAGIRDEIRVIVRPMNGSHGEAFLAFAPSFRQQFLAVAPGDAIRFTCVVRRIIASPFMEECKLLPRT